MFKKISGVRLFVSAIPLLYVGFLLVSKAIARATILNPIQRENLLPGASNWQLSKPALQGEIQGYPGADSVEVGSAIDIHVSTTAPSFNAEVYRMGYYGGAGATLKETIPNLKGTNRGSYFGDGLQMAFPTDCSGLEDCRQSTAGYIFEGAETNLRAANWQTSFTLDIPPNWVSGCYLMKLTENKTGKQWHVLFIVTDISRRAALLFYEPTYTEQAYNYWGGASAYQISNHASGVLPNADHATLISYDRPNIIYCGTGHYLQWIYPMQRFLEEEGYDVKYTTDRSIAKKGAQLSVVKGLMSAGHDEYWSQLELKNIMAAVNAGMSFAEFGGNNLYWQVRDEPNPVDPDGQDLYAIYKVSQLGFGKKQHIDPDNSLGPLGVPLTTTLWSIVDPGMVFLGTETSGQIVPGPHLAPFVVQNASCWVFNGTGLKNGDVIPNLIGGEVDTASPEQLQSLAVGEKAVAIGNSPYVAASGVHLVLNTVLLEKPLGNVIFDAGDVIWPILLSNFPSYEEQVNTVSGPFPKYWQYGYPQIPESQALRQITKNILNKMADPSHDTGGWVALPKSR